MMDKDLYHLAGRAGIAVEWRDYAGKPHTVAKHSLQAILAALGLPSETSDDLKLSHQLLEQPSAPLITTMVGERISLPFSDRAAPKHAVVYEEDGSRRDRTVELAHSGCELAGIETPGYHRVEYGNECVTVAVAPPRCPSIADFASDEKIYGLAAQIYALRRDGDCGIGDTGGVIELATKAATLGADLLALSPVHALFSAEPRHFSPYSPSSRLFYNPLHADARVIFGDDRVNSAYQKAGLLTSQLEAGPLIDWPRSTQAKMALFRCLFDQFSAHDLADARSSLAADFREFRAAGGELLEDHAVFEALHAHQSRVNPAVWNWSEWPSHLRNPSDSEVKRFATTNEQEVTFHCFLQWLADRSLAAAQHGAKQAGMRLGLLADLAVGMSGAGSHAWTSQRDVLTGLQIGAPPDLYSAKGQDWSLTTFSPRALGSSGFSPFIATLRAALRHAGGLRIDHAMGLLRLWVIPRGADAADGAYLSYPMKDLLSLTALEAHRHRAIIVGEDLGTIPPGFRESMAQAGIYGMRVLWFEHTGRHFRAPSMWDAEAAAMTSTHDLPTVAGWWRGIDIEQRAQVGWIKDNEAEQQVRAAERRSLWKSFQRAKATDREEPRPQQAALAVDAAVTFISEAASAICLLPLEDVLALDEQPNVPGTIDEFPNWRRRYPAEASELLSVSEVRNRLAALAKRGRQ
jgi:4-alpha-glucanotransferase